MSNSEIISAEELYESTAGNISTAEPIEHIIEDNEAVIKDEIHIENDVIFHYEDMVEFLQLPETDLAQLSIEEQSIVLAKLSNLARGTDFRQKFAANPQSLKLLIAYLEKNLELQDQQQSKDEIELQAKQKFRKNAISSLCNLSSDPLCADSLVQDDAATELMLKCSDKNHDEESRESISGFFGNLGRTDSGKARLEENTKVRSTLLAYCQDDRAAVSHKALSAIHNITNKSPKKTIATDQKTKETIFAMSKKALENYKGDPQALSVLSETITGLCFDTAGKHLYGDAKTKDLLISFYNKDPKCAVKVAKAMVNIIASSDDKVKTLYNDDDTYNFSQSFLAHDPSKDDLGIVLSLINNNITHKKPNRKYFSAELRDSLLNVLSKEENVVNQNIATFSRCLKLILKKSQDQDPAITSQVKELYSDPKIYDTLLKLAGQIKDGVQSDKRHVLGQESSDQVRGELAAAIANITYINPEMRELYATPEMCKALVTMAGQTSSEEDKRMILLAINNISLSEKGRKLFAEDEKFKDILLQSATDAQTEELMKEVSTALKRLSKTSDLFNGADEKIKTTLFDMGYKAKGNEAVASVALAIVGIVHNNKNDETVKLYSGADTAKFLEDLSQKATDDNARGAVAGAIAAISYRNYDDAAKHYCNEKTKNTLLDWGNKAKNDNCIIGVAAAIGSLAKYENEKSATNIFARDPKVEEALKNMREKLKDKSKEAQITNAQKEVSGSKKEKETTEPQTNEETTGPQRQEETTGPKTQEKTLTTSPSEATHSLEAINLQQRGSVHVANNVVVQAR